MTFDFENKKIVKVTEDNNFATQARQSVRRRWRSKLSDSRYSNDCECDLEIHVRDPRDRHPNDHAADAFSAIVSCQLES